MQQHLWHKISICLFATIPIIYQILTIPAQADNPVTPNSETTQSPVKIGDKITDFVVFPVGLNIGKRMVNSSFLVKGKEDGLEAVNFTNWLLPYDAVIQALKLNITTLADGQLEIKSPGLVTRIDPKKFGNDAELGLVLRVEDLETLLGIKARFDINEYAIILEVPWDNKSSANLAEIDNFIFLDLEGLPEVENKNINISAIEQKVNISGSDRQSTNYKGELTTVGSALGGSWFVRTNQRDLT
ncbi:hypothetical protein [Dolichospermum sp. UHCC 0259]|uniref:hypothetical protein n=1 Tax=Dolichospermum sp. UHCC 0259 TaxID=2590010 RepID=UPI0020C34D52|nr:hypothetical protein [Dolichospermum sp. UHCC 0259]